MKVQTSDDAKVNNDGKPYDVPCPSTTTTGSPYTIDYEIRPAPQAKYVNLSKLVLLILAIIATFLACLIFARDLWGQKNAEKVEHHHAAHVMSPSQNRFPFEDIMDDNDPFEMMGSDGGKSDEEPHLIKRTKVTIKLTPTDSDEFPGIFGMNRIALGGPPQMDDGFFDEILKTMMAVMNRPEERRSSFGDLPFFDGPNNGRPLHPKVIIVRKLPSGPSDSDFIPNLFALPPQSPSEKYKRPSEPFPFLPVNRPAHPEHSDRDRDSVRESLISKIMRDITLGGPGRLFGKPRHAQTAEPQGMSGAEGWQKYKSLVSKLAHEVDNVLESTSSLKQTVIEELNKMKENNPDAFEDPKPENPIRDFLTNALESLNKLGDPLTEASVIIKTEDGAMDLINKSDKKSLDTTIQSFLGEINEPLGRVFSTSTALTKTAGQETAPKSVLRGIVTVASQIVDLGKTVYDDISKVSSTVSDLPEAKPACSIPSPPEPVVDLKSDLEPTQQPNGGSEKNFFQDHSDSEENTDSK